MTRFGNAFLIISALLLFASAFLLPGKGGITGTNLDASYQFVLEDAANRGSVFGTEVIYTIGPLGHLNLPLGLGGFQTERLLYAVLLAAFSAYVSCTVVAEAALPIRAALLIWLVLQPPTMTLLHAAVAVRLLNPPALPWLKRAELWMFPALLGLFGMGKFTDMLSGIVVVCGPAAVFAYQGRWRGAMLLVSTFVISTLGVWLAAGQPLDAFAHYLRVAWDVANGFTAMTIMPANAVLICGLTGVAVLTMSTVFSALQTPRGIERVLGILLILACAFLSWKHAFVRADNHVGVFFSSIGAYTALLFVGREQRRWVSNSLIAVALTMGPVGFKLADLTLADTIPGFNRIAAIPFALLGKETDSSRKEQKDRERVRGEAALPKIKAAVGRAPVDIFNYQQAYAYLNDFVLRFRPMFQSYAAYTPRLQGINFDHYQSLRRPALVLFRIESVDSRWPWLDDAPLALQLLTDWRPITREKGFVLLEPAASTPAGEWRELTGGEAKWGTVISVLPHPLGSLISMTLEESRRSSLGSLKRFLYQGANLQLNVRTASGVNAAYNFIPEMAAHGVLLSPSLESLDDMIGWQLSALPPRQVTHFSLTPWAGHANEFRDGFRYRLRMWTPGTARDPSVLAQNGHTLLYPYLPVIPESVEPALSSWVVNGVELGGHHAPCRIQMSAPSGTPGIEGSALVVPATPGAEVLVKVHLKDGLGKVTEVGQMRLSPTAVQSIRVDIDFPVASISAGEFRILFEVSSIPRENRPMIIWGPLRWKSR